ncbi:MULTISPECIES: hypothetical protein [unclassified Streptomyces]|uniref:hypothetical protein n=1 Tax=unclassified Streptomyces TaxID=2593676 RepID=UPI001F03EF4E|nr:MULTISPECIES: hypothetical protein [unclassified Streptomyces]
MSYALPQPAHARPAQLVAGREQPPGRPVDAMAHYRATVASPATCVVLWRRHGVRVLPGALVLLAACWSSVDRHIFRPGVFTMPGIALGFTLLTVAVSRNGEDVVTPVDVVTPGGLTSP